MRPASSVLTVLAAAGLLSCADSTEASDGVVDTVTLASEVDNGISMNGISMNGISMNGISMNGISMNGISMNGSVGGNGIVAEKNGVTLWGKLLVGAKLEAQLTNGDKVALRINGAQLVGGRTVSGVKNSAVSGSVWTYDISYKSKRDWVPLCGVETVGKSTVPVMTVAMGGVFEKDGSWHDSKKLFTLSCEHATIGKCIFLGYRPWERNGNMVYHTAACTRMLRADYCGDGVPHTVDGTPINIYDGIHVQYDAADWPVEAEWNADGAVCVRNAKQTRSGVLLGEVPSCLRALQDRKCGDLDHFDDDTLLMDEFDHNAND